MSPALYLRLNHAVYRGWDSEVEHLLQKGYDPNLLSMQYNSSLMIAARRHHWNILDLLLQYGADPNLVNEKGEDVLSILGESPYIDRDNIPPTSFPTFLIEEHAPISIGMLVYGLFWFFVEISQVFIKFSPCNHK